MYLQRVYDNRYIIIYFIIFKLIICHICHIKEFITGKSENMEMNISKLLCNHKCTAIRIYSFPYFQFSSFLTLSCTTFQYIK